MHEDIEVLAVFCSAMVGGAIVLAGWFCGRAGRYLPGTHDDERFDTVDGRWEERTAPKTWNIRAKPPASPTSDAGS